MRASVCVPENCRCEYSLSKLRKAVIKGETHPIAKRKNTAANITKNKRKAERVV